MYSRYNENNEDKEVMEQYNKGDNGQWKGTVQWTMEGGSTMEQWMGTVDNGRGQWTMEGN